MGKILINSSRFSNPTRIQDEFNTIHLSNTTFTKDQQHKIIHNLNCSGIDKNQELLKNSLNTTISWINLDAWREEEQVQHYEKPCIPGKNNVLGEIHKS